MSGFAELLLLALLVPAAAEEPGPIGSPPLETHELVFEESVAPRYPTTVEELPRRGQLVVVRDERFPVVQIEVVFPVGSHSAWWQENNLDYHWRAVLFGTASSGVADQATVFVGERACGFRFMTPSSKLAEAVQEVADALVAGHGDIEIDDGKLLRRSWRDLRESPSFLLERGVSSAVYARGDVRRGQFGRPRGVELDRYELREIRDRILRMEGWAIGMAGQVSVEDARAAVEVLPIGRDDTEVTTGWEEAVLPLLPEQDRPGTRSYRAAGSREVLLAWARDGLFADDEDAPAAILADQVIVRRIERRLRDDRGMSYMTHSSGLVGIQSRAYEIVLSTKPSRRAEFEALVDLELDRVVAEGLDPEEVERARAMLWGSELRDTRAPFQIMGSSLSHLVRRDSGFVLARLYERSRSATFEQVDAVARRFWNRDAFTLVRIRAGRFRR